jgi:uncharacterized RDD family membrane protein YckC
MSSDNPFAPPRADVADPAGDGPAGLELAGRWGRLGASLIDGVINIVFVFTPLLMTIGWDGYMRAVAAHAAGGSIVDLYGTIFRGGAIGYVLLALLQGWFVRTYSASIGKKLVGMRVVRASGERADFVRLFFVRGGFAFLIGLIPVVGGLLVIVDSCLIFRRSRRCLHDVVADTVVVKVPAAA